MRQDTQRDIQVYKMLIDGAWVDASDGKTLETINPATGAVWVTAIETRDSGKMFAETRWQARYISEFLIFYAGAADKINGETLPIDKPDMFVFTNRESLGVVAAVVPLNSQLFFTAVEIGSALVAGNAVVLKPSEHAPAVILEFGRLIAEAGIPEGVVNIVTGHGDPCGRALTSHPLVARISLTGGPVAARHLLMNATRNFAKVSLELGGKCPFIVFLEADLESAVNGSVAGIFAASGQSCVAGSRLIVHEDVADDFIARMAAIARAIRMSRQVCAGIVWMNLTDAPVGNPFGTR